MEIFDKIKKFFTKHYWIFLLFILLISYGQILKMLPWQDDNALFFKLAHIQEPAGFLGKGIFGEGAYKYTAFFYYPIYKLFGYTTFYYFLFSFATYFLSVLILYKVISQVFGERSGKLSSFLYACGFIASDGFIRLYNSLITSLSIIFLTLLFYFYWKYFRKRNIWFYVLSVFFYFLSIEFARARTHYLIAPIILFEILLFTLRDKVKNIYRSILRLIPFLFIFYKYFVSNPDSRSKDVFVFVKSLLHGDLSVLYGYFSSLSNLFVPSWITNKNFHFLIFSIILIAVVYFLLKRSKGSRYILINIPLAIVWYVAVREIYLIPSLNPSANQVGLVYLGGIIFLLLCTITFYIQKRLVVYYLLFVFWILVNLVSYSAYSPTVIFDSINRYLAHSFWAVTILFALLVKNIDGKKITKTLSILIVFYGLGNLTNSFLYQKNLLISRSYPVKEFYLKMKNLLPNIKKDDMLYFDVADNARSYFADAFSVAQMPDTTAIAWRYGIDRYDFYMSENYESFINQVRDNNVDLEKIYTFFYSKEVGLVSTSAEFNKLNKGYSASESVSDQRLTDVYSFKNSYSCVLRPTLSLTLSATPSEKDTLTLQENFPYLVAGNYLEAKDNFYNLAKVITSSQWQNRVSQNLSDKNSNTVWQADRVLWDKEKTFFGFDLGKTQVVDRFIWINGFGNNTPISYSVEVSLNGRDWDEVAKVESLRRIDASDPNEIIFKPVRVKYIRMVIAKTLNSDSAGISEAWVIPAGFGGYSVSKLEELIKSQEFALLLKKSRVSLLWKSNSSDNWQKDYTSSFDLIADGMIRDYKVVVPCRGTKLDSIKFDGFQFPMDLKLYQLKVSYSPIQ